MGKFKFLCLGNWHPNGSKHLFTSTNADAASLSTDTQAQFPAVGFVPLLHPK